MPEGWRAREAILRFMYFVFQIRDEGFSAVYLVSTMTASNQQAISLSMKHDSRFGQFCRTDIVLRENILNQTGINIDISPEAKQNPNEIN